MLTLRIHKEVTGVRVPRTLLQKLFKGVMTAQKKRGWQGEVNLVLTNSRSLKKLNREYRSLDKVTDVLSFNIDQPDSIENTVGEIYISIAVARTQAKEAGCSVQNEILRLTCHGLLHLLGYDHTQKSDSKQMFDLQQKYLARFTCLGGACD